MALTPEDRALFIKLFSGPRQRGRDRFGGRLMDLVQHDDGSIGFVPNESRAKFGKLFDEVIDDIFRPEPEPEDVELPNEAQGSSLSLRNALAGTAS